MEIDDQIAVLMIVIGVVALFSMTLWMLYQTKQKLDLVQTEANNRSLGYGHLNYNYPRPEIMAKGLRLLYDMDKFFDWTADERLKSLCLDLVYAYSQLPLNSSAGLLDQIDQLEGEILQTKIQQDNKNREWLPKYQHIFVCFRRFSETDELGRINYA